VSSLRIFHVSIARPQRRSASYRFSLVAIPCHIVRACGLHLSCCAW
jgi:hypothetical protein